MVTLIILSFEGFCSALENVLQAKCRNLTPISFSVSWIFLVSCNLCSWEGIWCFTCCFFNMTTTLYRGGGCRRGILVLRQDHRQPYLYYLDHRWDIFETDRSSSVVVTCWEKGDLVALRWHLASFENLHQCVRFRISFCETIC